MLRGQSIPVQLYALEGEAGLGPWTTHRSPSPRQLVGRVAELDVLQGALDHCASTGQGSVVLVVGDPGVGKTRLLSATDGLGIAWKSAAGDRLAWSAGASSGALTLRGHTIRVDLRYTGDGKAFVPFPIDAMYTSAFPKQKLPRRAHTRVGGEVTVDGDRWTLEGMGCRATTGCSTPTDAWAHVNQWDQDEPFVLEGFSGQVKLGPLMTPLTTMACVRHRGVSYDFNAPRDVLLRDGRRHPPALGLRVREQARHD